MRSQTHTELSKKLTEPKVYLITLIIERAVSWDFCMKSLMNVFHKTQEDAQVLTHQIQTDGEAICGAYISEIAETKAQTIEEQAKKEGFTLQCLLEEV